MQPYLVHIEREDLDSMNMLVIDDRGRAAARRYHNSYNVKVDSTFDNNRPQDMETWYCEDETSARDLCRHLAQKCPGRNVNMYKLAGVATSAPTPASFATYSEKGLVP